MFLPLLPKDNLNLIIIFVSLTTLQATYMLKTILFNETEGIFLKNFSKVSVMMSRYITGNLVVLKSLCNSSILFNLQNV